MRYGQPQDGDVNFLRGHADAKACFNNSGMPSRVVVNLVNGDWDDERLTYMYYRRGPRRIVDYGEVGFLQRWWSWHLPTEQTGKTRY